MMAAVRHALGKPIQGGNTVLILSRKTGEQIVVPEFGVSVKVIAIKGKTIRLGITATAGVPILRSELAPRRREMHPVPPRQSEVIGETKRQSPS